MRDAIGDMLPTAVVAAISPLPIVAVVLMLVTPRGRVNGPAFVLGWVLGYAVIGAVVLSVSSGASASDDGTPATWVSVLELVLGLLALLLGVRQFRGRPRGDAKAPTPHWMQDLDRFEPPKAIGTGVLLSAVNPKNLLIAVAGAVAIAQTGISGGEQAVAWIIFIVVASLGVATPVVAVLVLGDRSRRALDEIKDWLVSNNATIVSVIMVVIGAKLVGDAISGF
jgi:threonine/homoserine/homoserine lactone efflux protein